MATKDVAVNALAANALAANALAANALAANAPTAKPELNLTNLNEMNSKGKPKYFRRPHPHPFMEQANVGLKKRGAVNTRVGPGFAPDRIPAGVYKLYEGRIQVGNTFRLNNNLGTFILFTEVNPVGGEILYEGTDRDGESEIYRESERGEGKKWTVYKRMVAGGSSKKRSLKKRSLKRKITHRKKKGTK